MFLVPSVVALFPFCQHYKGDASKQVEKTATAPCEELPLEMHRPRRDANTPGAQTLRIRTAPKGDANDPGVREAWASGPACLRGKTLTMSSCKRGTQRLANVPPGPSPSSEERIQNNET